MIDWSLYKNFTRDEMKCSHTGECEIAPELMDILQSMRDEIGRPIFVSSGYRASSHPVEAMKMKPGEHAQGWAVDLICYGAQTLEYMRMAQDRDVKRIGLFQKGRASARFIHLGIGDKFSLEYPLAVWTY